MDPEFARILGRVLLVGGIMGGVAAGALVIAFRAFSEKGTRSEVRGVALIAGVIGFVLICCAVLMIFSFPQR